MVEMPEETFFGDIFPDFIIMRTHLDVVFFAVCQYTYGGATGYIYIFLFFNGSYS